MSGAGRDADAATLERLWLDRLHALGSPVAHELRNALNGVAVNLEVVRGRAARPDASAAAVVPFAEAAAGQLEALAALVEALLALVRPVPEPPDVGALAGRLGTLLDAVARSEGGSVTVRVLPDGDAVRAGVPGEALRALLAAALLAAADRRAALLCEVDGTAGPALRLRRDDGAPLPAVPTDVRALAERLHARLEGAPAAWTLVLPPAGGRPDEPLSGQTRTV